MKLNEVTKTGFYTTDNRRMVIYEVLENTDDTLLDDTLLVDEWIYEYIDDNGIRHYEADGCMYSVQNYADDIEVEEITDTSYTIYGNSGALMCEDKPTPKEIKIEDLLPYLCEGWVAMDKDGSWYWYSTEPEKVEIVWDDYFGEGDVCPLANIKPVEDWTKSLIKVSGE